MNELNFPSQTLLINWSISGVILGSSCVAGKRPLTCRSVLSPISFFLYHPLRSQSSTFLSLTFLSSSSKDCSGTNVPRIPHLYLYLARLDLVSLFPYIPPSCSFSRGSEATSRLPPLLYREFSEGRSEALLIFASTASQRAHKRHLYITLSQTDLSTTFHAVRSRLGNAIIKARTKTGIYLRCLKPSRHILYI